MAGDLFVSGGSRASAAHASRHCKAWPNYRTARRLSPNHGVADVDLNYHHQQDQWTLESNFKSDACLESVLRSLLNSESTPQLNVHFEYPSLLGSGLRGGPRGATP